MKSKIILILCAGLFTLAASAQVVIGKTSIDGDGILDFGSDVKGIVLSPASNVDNIAASAGTIAFDGNTGSFRYHNGAGWSTATEGGKTGGTITGTDTNKVFIGATTSTTSDAAVLVLGKDSGENKALILPRIANGNLKINDLTPGLMYYDTVCKMVMVYNGNSWVGY
jgi:hypothetical protein